MDSSEQYESWQSLIQLLDDLTPFRKSIDEAMKDGYYRWDNHFGKCSVCEFLWSDCECEDRYLPLDEEGEEIDEDRLFNDLTAKAMNGDGK